MLIVYFNKLRGEGGKLVVVVVIFFCKKVGMGMEGLINLDFLLTI